MPPTATHRTVLSFMAHPDDAEIFCGGTLARLAEAGWAIHIATVANGDCGTMTEAPGPIARRRAEEARAAAAQIGATYHGLGEGDFFVVYDKPTLHKAVDLFGVAPSLVFTHPAKDYMMDHEMAHLLARAASFAYAAPNASEAPRKPESSIPYLYYCDPADGADPLGRPVEPTTLVDISAQVEKKAAMLACHTSQRQWLRDHHGVDEYIAAMRRQAAARGRLLGTAAAEAFVQHRGHAYPADDVLKAMFG